MGRITTVEVQAGHAFPPLKKAISQDKVNAFESCMKMVWVDPKRTSLHDDPKKAAEAGLRTPIASGMQHVAYFTQLLTACFGTEFGKSGSMQTRILAPMRHGDQMSYEAVVVSTQPDGGSLLVVVDIAAKNQDGVTCAGGRASVVLHGVADGDAN